MRKALSFFAIAAFAASPGVAQEGGVPTVFPTTPAKAVEATRDCAAATSRSTVSDEVMLGRGWGPAEYRDAEGKTLEADNLAVKGFWKPDGYPVILVDLSEPKKPKQCRIMSGYDDGFAYSDVVLELTNAFGPPRTSTEDGRMGFLSNRHMIALAQKKTPNQSLFVILVQELGE